MSGRRPVFEDLRLLARNGAKMFNETRSILLPVLLCIFLTQTAWTGIYGCVVTRNMFLYDGDNLFDGLKNAGLAMLAIAAVSCLLITLAIFHFKRIVRGWICLSSVACTFVISGCIFNDIVKKLVEDQTTLLSIVAALTVAYGGGGVMAFFTTHLPAWFHQLYVITNCAAVATFYLTCLPGHTAWCLLAVVAGWDIFAVLSPCGPLKLALEHSQDYGADLLRCMMFTAGSEEEEEEDCEGAATAAVLDAAAAAASEAEDELRVVEDVECEECEDVSDEGEEEAVVVSRPTRRLTAGADVDAELIRKHLQAMMDDYEGVSTASGDENEGASSGDSSIEVNDDIQKASSSIEKKGEGKREKTAREALNTGSHLGFGDFIFYSILVGKSMAVGFFPALVSTAGVITGLAYTLSIPHDQETLPALPISIAFGMFCHFYTVAQLNAIEFVLNYLFV